MVLISRSPKQISCSVHASFQLLPLLFPTTLESSVFSLCTGKDSRGFYGPSLELTSIICADIPLATIVMWYLTVRKAGKCSLAVCAQRKEEMLCLVASQSLPHHLNVNSFYQLKDVGI